jgi:hypothetical protein
MARYWLTLACFLASVYGNAMPNPFPAAIPNPMPAAMPAPTPRARLEERQAVGLYIYSPVISGTTSTCRFLF